MEGLTIRKKVTPPVSQGSRSVSEALFSGVMGLLLLVLIPLLLLTLLFSFIWHKAFPEKPATPRPVVRHEVPNSLFPLCYQYLMGEEISAGAAEYFGDDEPLIRYQSAASTNFFNGYFSDFKIECLQGIFVQRINFDATLTEVESMPLCFFNYATRESEELLDLKGYTLSTQERPNHFTIMATSQDDSAEEFTATAFELEIILTNALYTPPSHYPS